jgi:addiction module RelE/StbE family toxin
VTVIWTPEAEQDRADIWDYIEADDHGAAVRMDVLFGEAAARLASHPRMGRTGKIPGTRELIPHRSYRLVYEIDGDTVWVLALVHTARQRPPVEGVRTSYPKWLLQFSSPSLRLSHSLRPSFRGGAKATSPESIATGGRKARVRRAYYLTNKRSWLWIPGSLRCASRPGMTNEGVGASPLQGRAKCRPALCSQYVFSRGLSPAPEDGTNASRH